MIWFEFSASCHPLSTLNSTFREFSDMDSHFRSHRVTKAQDSRATVEQRGNAMLTTIGYENSSLEDFVETLKLSNVEVLVDIRDRAQSRKPGFSKTALSEAVRNAGIEYLHIRALGDPKEGRDAARAGMIERFREIFSAVLETESAIEALSNVEKIARSKRICLMCYEKDHRYCHRKMVSDKLEAAIGIPAKHLGVLNNGAKRRSSGRVLHISQSATA